MKHGFCIMLLAISSCVSHDFPLENNCNVTNPIKDLQWLKAEVADLNNSEIGRKFSFITQATYNLETVFIVRNCCPMCSTVPPPVYACNGELLFRTTDEQYADVTGERLIWKPAEYNCTF